MLYFQSSIVSISIKAHKIMKNKLTIKGTYSATTNDKPI